MAKCLYPECGKIVNTHGCRGGVKIESWCDSPAVLAALPRVFLREGENYRPLLIQKASPFQNNFVIATFAGVESMDAAERLRGRVLYAAREELPIGPDEVLVVELIGLPVKDSEGNVLGTLKDVIRPANTDIYVVSTPRGEGMIPAVPEFVRGVDIEKGITVAPIEGMLP